MNPQEWQTLEHIVDGALASPEKQQKEYIEHACREKPELKTKVLELLESIKSSEGFLEAPQTYHRDWLLSFDVEAGHLSAHSSLIGTRIGSYEITRLIDEGGMGSVFLAERADGVFDHRVALKLIRRGMDTSANLARFKREQSILARLNHPNIARLYNGGITEEGLPYLIMEYVEGIPIDQYCEKHELDIAGRLELFLTVCQAVQYAHSNLIIHRDLKPANILVSPRGEVTILDFGIAKLLETDAGDHELFQTIPGHKILTLGYAAPEQIKQDTATTPTDIYTLGVLLYKILTGLGPFDFEDKSFSEIETIICEQSPKNPSVRSPRWNKELKGDLDAIILKCLRKDSARRYQAVGELITDLQSYRQGKTVGAYKGSISYSVTKFAKRHKKGMLLSGIMVLMLVSFSIIYTININKQRNQARREAQKAEQVTQFLSNLFESNDPSISQGDTLTAYQLLDRGLHRINQLKTPEIHAEMLVVIGNAYASLGFQDKAETILDSAITETRNIYSADSPELAKALYARGIAESINDDIALPFFRRSYKIRKSILGEDDPLTLASMAKLAHSMRNVGKLDSAALLAMKVYQAELRSAGIDTLELIGSMGSLAYIYRKQGKLEAAEKLYKKIIPLLEQSESSGNNLRLALYYNNLAFVYRDLKNYKEAETYLRKSLLINERLRGKGHATTHMIRNNLIAVLSKQHKYTEAYEALKENLYYVQNKYSENHWRTASSYQSLGDFLIRRHRYKEAAKNLKKSVNIYQNTLGADHIWTAQAEGLLAADLYFQNDSAEADSLYEASFLKLKTAAPDFRPFNVTQVQKLIKVYNQAGEQKYQRQISDYQSLITEKHMP